MQHRRQVVLGCLLSLVVCLSSAMAAPQYPFPQHMTYAPGTIRPNHRTQTQQDNDVRAFYNAWKADYVLPAGTAPSGYPMYRISFGANNPGRTVSEGQGFGMIIVALMAGHDAAARRIFNGLWEFSRQYPSAIDARLMTWQVPVVPGESATAFDGDADIAYGLLLAHAQWGSNGRINYAAQAQTVLTAILESTIGPVSRLPMLGDWVAPGGVPHNQYTPRSSDFMPAHFRAYRRFTGNPVWTTVVRKCQAVITSLQTRYSPLTGLLPDFIIQAKSAPKPAPGFFLEGPHDGAYFYNAGRDPWRLGTDALLNHDPISLGQVQKMSNWMQTAASNNPYRIRAGYRLNGRPLPGSDYFTTFFVAPFGVAAMTNPNQQAWLNAIYNAVRNTHEDYYEDTVTLLTLLVMTGNYWDPTTMAAPFLP